MFRPVRPFLESPPAQRVRMVTDGTRTLCWAVVVPDDVVEIRIEVCGEDDPVRDERAGRRLRDELLARDDVIDAGFARSDDAPPPGAKGPGATDAVVLVTTVAPAAAATVIAFIRAWAQRSSHRKVILSSDGSVEIHGAISRRDERLVRDLHSARSDQGPGGADLAEDEHGG